MFEATVVYYVSSEKCFDHLCLRETFCAAWTDEDLSFVMFNNATDVRKGLLVKVIQLSLLMWRLSKIELCRSNGKVLISMRCQLCVDHKNSTSVFFLKIVQAGALLSELILQTGFLRNF